MRLIDIDAFRKDWGLAERCEDCERDARECQYDQIHTRMDFCGWLDDAEIIDAVPVVRCKDCLYYDESIEGVAGFHRCSFFLRLEPTGGFCHYAIRRQITAESE